MSICLHVGFSKTATTFLQLRYFPSHPELHFLGQPTPDKKVLEFQRLVRWRNELQYKNSTAQTLFNESIRDLVKNKNVVISNEGFTVTNCTDPVIICKRLKFFFPEAKILFTIREQFSRLSSYYFETQKEGIKYYNYFDKFSTWIHKDMGYNKVQSVSLGCQYYKYIECYQYYFGKENVFVIPFELLKRNPRSFLHDICTFLEISDFFVENTQENTGLLKGQVTIAGITRECRLLGLTMRIISKILPGLFTSLYRKSGKATVKWPDEIKQNLSAMFSEDNRRLQNILSYDLKSYGYIM